MKENIIHCQLLKAQSHCEPERMRGWAICPQSLRVRRGGLAVTIEINQQLAINDRQHHPIVDKGKKK